MSAKRNYCWHPVLIRFRPIGLKWRKGWQCTNCKRIYSLKLKEAK
jgi:hypothetical protein